MKSKTVVVVFALLFVGSLIPKIAQATDYPNREIEFVCAAAVGGSADIFSRLTSKFSEKYVGKPIVVVNKPGGGLSRGFSYLAAAKPDGYTIGLISNSLIAHTYLMKGITYHYKKDYSVITQIDYNAQGIFVKKGGDFDVPLNALIKKVKDKPEEIKIGISGKWTTEDFVRAIFEDEANIKFRRVSFAGGGEAISALLGGHIDVLISPASEWAPLYNGGELSVLAVSTEQRDPRFPNIPTFKELGYNVVLATYHWIAAPVGTPEPIVKFLAESFKKAFSEEAFKEAVDKQGATAAWEDPAGSLKTMEKVDQVYQRMVNKFNLKPE